MKKKKIIILIIIILILIICTFIIYKNIYLIEDWIESVKISRYGEPINLETGTINNDFFGISKNSSNARKTTEGINEAIRYANKNNIEYIKLEKGNYCIMAHRSENEKRGLILCSNITLDLNGSTITAETSNATNYSIITIANVENIKLLNGILIGDKDTHEYTENSTHEWGMGITIRSAKNVQIENIQITETTGDGIYINKDADDINSTNVEISNCNIYNCRRQGITVISASNVIIRDNEIHDIYGTNPQSAIDLESNLDEELIENVEIYNNNMYNFGSVYAIKVQKNVHSTNIYNNKIQNTIIVYDEKDKIQISNNNINNGDIVLYNSLSYRNQGRYIEKAIVENNNINSGNIQVNRINNLKVSNNYITNGAVTIISTNTILENNIVVNEKEEKEYAYKIEPLNYKDIFYVYKNNNHSFGNIKENEIIVDDGILRLTDDLSNIPIE